MKKSSRLEIHGVIQLFHMDPKLFSLMEKSIKGTINGNILPNRISTGEEHLTISAI